MTQRWWTLAVAGLLLAGCGQAWPGAAERGATLSRAAAAEKASKNPFSGLAVTVEPAEADGDRVSLKATNGIKLKVAVTYEDGGIQAVSVNRSVLVKSGRLMLTREQAEPLEWLITAIAEPPGEAEATASPEARRKKSYLTILTQLAAGLEAAKAKKDRAKDVETVVDGLRAYVKAAKAERDDDAR